MKTSAAVIQREFDSLATEYESNRLADWYKAHADEIVAHAPPMQRGNILDIGSASGYLLRRLAQKYPGVSAVGIDLSPAMIAQARQRAQETGAQGLKFLCDDWEELSESTRQVLSEHKFTLVVCANAFHYFSDPQRAATDIFNLLEEGGTLLLLEREKSRSVLTWLWGILHRYFIKDHVEFYTTTELVNLLQQAGFSQVSVVKTITRYFWKGKSFTSIALIEGRKGDH